MTRRFALIAGSWLLAASTGCAICSSPFDYDYAAYGGRWERGDRCRGRVGSVFEPAEARLISPQEPEKVEPGELAPDEPVPEPPADE